MTAQQLYSETVSSLSAEERLKLASLILNDLYGSTAEQYGTSWSPTDEEEITRYALEHAAATYPEVEDLVPEGGRTGMRQFGSARGLISMAPDFDEPLEDFAPYME